MTQIINWGILYDQLGGFLVGIILGFVLGYFAQAKRVADMAHEEALQALHQIDDLRHDFHDPGKKESSDG